MSGKAYWNGEFISATDLRIDVWDAGFVQGVTIAEQMRTFGGRLFCLEEHLDRLTNSLETIGLSLPNRAQLAGVARQLVTENHPLLSPGDDLGLSLFVTPGPYAGFSSDAPAGPNVGMHTYPVAFGGFASKYDSGQALVLTKIRQVPDNCWPSHLKCRSRMHYYLADLEARRIDPAARALLLDQHGFVTEASTANILIYRADQGILSPPINKILPGISLATLQAIAAERAIPFQFRDIYPSELAYAQEAMLCSTSPCLLPVTSFDGHPIANGAPGPIFRTLLAAWSERVGLDIHGQAQRFARR